MLFLLSWWRAWHRMHTSETQELIFPYLQSGQMIHRKMYSFLLGTTEKWFMQRLKSKNMKNSNKNNTIVVTLRRLLWRKWLVKQWMAETMQLLTTLLGKSQGKCFLFLSECITGHLSPTFIGFYLKTQCFVWKITLSYKWPSYRKKLLLLHKNMYNIK